MQLAAFKRGSWRQGLGHLGGCQIYNAESRENPHKPLQPIVLHPPTAFLFKNKGDGGWSSKHNS